MFVKVKAVAGRRFPAEGAEFAEKKARGGMFSGWKMKRVGV